MIQTPEWHFQSSSQQPRRIIGLNDAGIASFNGDYFKSIAREVIQNSLDAKDKTQDCPVTVEFENFDLPAMSFPNRDKLKMAFNDCVSFASKFMKDSKSAAEFEKAVSVLTKKKIPVLRIGDFGTTGLTGDDGAIDSQWLALTGASGLSAKGHSPQVVFGLFFTQHVRGRKNIDFLVLPN
jgi:hypothetical protein